MIYIVLHHNILLKNAVYTAECEEKNEIHKSCNQRLLPGPKRVQRARKILPGMQFIPVLSGSPAVRERQSCKLAPNRVCADTQKSGDA